MDWKEVDYYPSKPGSQKALWKDFSFPDFKSGLEFVNKVGEIAEKMGHHPDINLKWGYVSVWTTSHDQHKITGKDYDLAKKIDEIKI